MEVHQGRLDAFPPHQLSDFAAMRPESAALLVDYASLRSDSVVPNAALQLDCGEMNVDDLCTSGFGQHAIKSENDFCALCECPIADRTLLTVSGRAYHTQCLRCYTCSVPLETFSSCFMKESNMMCKHCYTRQFGTKCASCDRVIQSADWVRRARSFVYHLACFACDQCKRQLSTGEEFALQNNRLLCKQHYVELLEGDSGTGQPKQKAKRVRTTFAEEQLSVLQAHFQIDSNPDGADLERIANMTGLSKRVTQVWFQNSRARQKKYQGKGKGGGIDGRSSEEGGTPAKSPGSSDDGMIFPTSVTTSAEEAMLPETSSITLGLHAIHYD